MIDVINPPGAPAPVGAYSPAVVANGWVFVSGQIGADPTTGALQQGIVAQTRQALTNLTGLLDEAGSGIDQVVSATCLLADMDDFDRFNQVYQEFFHRPFPARMTYGVRLGEGMLVEIRTISLANRVTAS